MMNPEKRLFSGKPMFYLPAGLKTDRLLAGR